MRTYLRKTKYDIPFIAIGLYRVVCVGWRTRAVTIRDCIAFLLSMNMWGLTPDFLDVLENGFKEFFEKEVPGNPQKAEYLIPIFIGELLEQGKMSVKVLKTNDTWYGMTYHEDVAAVKDSFKKMLADGLYKADLFADL